MKRNRIIYAILIFAVILLGLATRSGSGMIPAPMKKYGGDTLWALAAYLAVAFLFPRFSIVKVALIAAVLSLAIEVSQLYHADWIEQIRQMRLGGLLLGHGFCGAIYSVTLWESASARFWNGVRGEIG